MALTNMQKAFAYNQHFVAMLNVINAARLNPPESGHKHHIVPRCWFKMNNLPIDNSADNLVLLSYEDHTKVHKLAFLCAKAGKFKGKMAYAYHRLTKGELISNDCFRGEASSRYGVKISEETRKKMSESHKCLTATDDARKKMSESKKGENHPLFGKHHSDDTKRKMSQAFIGRTWKIIDGKRKWISKEVK